MSQEIMKQDQNVPALMLKDVKKTYVVGDNEVHALKGVSVYFRKSEFVSILGPSGCGKTTMLNIVGGLDRYTSGDLFIDGISTKNYNDRDWDTYRNHRIGFVFQSYNLIPHQTVLSNVELALTIGGISKEERVRRAKQALEKVGLKGQESKRPNQLSGGQCQRVAIARALVNEPDILLADEPTGALDSKTSIQIMELIKEISKDKLVIMVTHNGDIAEQYSTRIVSLKDGEIVNDTNPYEFSEEQDEEIKEDKIVAKKVKGVKKEKRSKMSLWTSFKLSLRNLFTKKGRTALTSFAGSIGIIGISLILAVSQGTTAYIDHVQETTLSSYPITLETEAVDVMSLMESFMNVGKGEPGHELDAVYKDPVIAEMVNALASANSGVNDLTSFKAFLEEELAKPDSALSNAITGVNYSYALDFKVYTKHVNKAGVEEIIKSDTNEIMADMIARYMAGKAGSGSIPSGGTGSSSSSSPFASMMMGSGLWEKLLPAKDGGLVNDLLKKQYKLVYGDWPTQANEIVLVVNEHNELDDLTLYALGLIGESEINAIIDAAVKGQELPKDNKKWTYDEIRQKEFKTILPYDAYQKMGDVFVNILDTPSGLELLYNGAYTLKVKGIIRANPDSETHMLKGKIGYTYKLTEHIVYNAENSAVVRAQKANPSIDVLTGKPFKSTTETMTVEEKAEAFKSYVSGLDNEAKKKVYIGVKSVMNSFELGEEIEKRFDALQTREEKLDKIATLYSMQANLSKEDVLVYLADMQNEQIDKLLKETILPLEIQGEYAFKQQMIYGGVDAQILATQLDNEINGNAALEIEPYSIYAMSSYYDNVMDFSNSSLNANLKAFGMISLATPTHINIYASSFANKDVILAQIEEYNKTQGPAKEIKYNDYMGLLMSGITTIIDAIKYILIAFVSISLIVSSIMIAVITLISVQERTKEIGILRSIGASKKDVSSLFNAETLIIGLMAGLMGIGVTYLLCIPINLILQALTDIPTLRAILPVGAAAILVGISVLLNVISGIIPSRSAAKKDPVIALRTE